jgi:hypothetical protein
MISIFARPSYLGNLHPGHTNELNTHRLSSRIRGEEIAEYAGFKLNPRSGYENDVLIYVKPTGFGHIKDGSFIDFLDGLQEGRFDLLKKRPKLIVIATSINSFEVLKKELPQHKITCIPHHHINFDNLTRTKRVINTCGYIGSPSPIAFKMYKEIGKAVRKLGMKFITCFNYKTRQEAIDFYKKIDILIVGAWQLGDPNPHKIPTKLINAMSFKIPSIAYPLAGYKEIEGFYLPAGNMEEVIAGIKKLKNKEFYNEFAEKIYKKSENYHIARIARLYGKLKRVN